ncbi:MAG: hypothetical protein C4532_17655 [Candidatus Abyssobacteria bacterium SURF_17]|uniref:Uncharacterized protein n=1 Tax=Candidatus Abyssobacteria bacterium SURF_17 TaxID=2093361 RepID=A0A419EQG9_9BACT|nr:MAG: hypothetical protein C4532_17655 [Candidatus Abyssubacteria bacterium SURF_17]
MGLTPPSEVFFHHKVTKGAGRNQKRNRDPQIMLIHADSQKKRRKAFGNTNYTNYTNEWHK